MATHLTKPTSMGTAAEYQAKYQATAKGKAARARASAKYQASEKGKATAARYKASKKRKVVQHRYNVKRTRARAERRVREFEATPTLIHILISQAVAHNNNPRGGWGVGGGSKDEAGGGRGDKKNINLPRPPEKK